MMESPLLISIVVFLMVMSGAAAAVSYGEVRSWSRGWRKRVEAKPHEAEEEEEEGEKPLTGWEYLKLRIFGVLERMGQATQPKEQAEISDLKRTLIIAGFRKPGAAMAFFGVKLLLAAALPALALIIPNPAMADMTPLSRTGVYVFLAVMGLYAPQLWLGRMVTRRKGRLLNSFPDALDLLVVCVEAGLGLDAAVARAGRELSLAHPELSEEFEILSLEMRAGLPRQQALTNLGARIDLDEVRSLVALLIQTDRFGTSVGQALRVYSDSMRKDRAMRAEEMAAKLPVKMLFPLMIFIFPSLFIVILGPAIVQGVRVLLPALSTN